MLDHPMGAGSQGSFRLDFDPRVRLEFHGSKISSDGGLLLFRELDETLGLHDLAGRSLRDTRTGKNGVHSLVDLMRHETQTEAPVPLVGRQTFKPSCDLFVLIAQHRAVAIARRVNLMVSPT